MGRAFPGGICDEEGRIAYLGVGGELLAVDLATGAVNWRLADDSEPLAASDRHLLTRRNRPSESLLELREAESGRTLASLTAAELPGFESVSPDDALDAMVRDASGGAEILWRSQRRYAGGAMPGRGLAPRGSSAGAVLLNETTGRVRAIAAAPRAAPAPLEPVAAGPDTIAAARLGDKEFALRQEGGRIKLEARSAGGELRWSTGVGAAKSAMPGPLRQ